jgi:hypothetical protein
VINREADRYDRSEWMLSSRQVYRRTSDTAEMLGHNLTYINAGVRSPRALRLSLTGHWPGLMQDADSLHQEQWNATERQSLTSFKSAYDNHKAE